MVEEAISLIEKQRDTYIIQMKNVNSYARNKRYENKLKEQIMNDIKIRNYILRILRKKKQEERQ